MSLGTIDYDGLQPQGGVAFLNLYTQPSEHLTQVKGKVNPLRVAALIKAEPKPR
jgi:hypothetical protein